MKKFFFDSLKLCFENKRAPNNDFTPTSLQSCNDIIYFNVYDEIEVDILEV
jgi:hypothetical protein